MIVKFHRRGVGRGSGAPEYLLGRDGMREDATLLRGDPQEVQDLCDSSPYTKKYTSGVLSFEESNIPESDKQELMDSFESTLMAGLDKDQYSVLWVEHRDKGRLELNFVIPNVELTTGKRLQPYYDRADRPLVDAWKECANVNYSLSDPNDPEKTRFLVTPRNLPQNKLEAAEALNQFVSTGVEAGFIKDRSDIVNALQEQGFTVARQTPSSISIADPDGGRNIRLKGALYEQNFSVGESPEREYRNAKDHYQQQRSAEYERNRRNIEERIATKTEYHQARYSRGTARIRSERQGIIQGQDVAMVRDGFSASNLHISRDVGIVSQSQDRHTESAVRVLGAAHGQRSDVELHEHSTRTNGGESLRQSRDRSNLRGEQRLHGDTGVLDDRARKNAVERIREIRQRSSENRAGIENGVNQLNQASDGFKSAINQRSEKNRGFNAAVSGVPDRIQSLNQSINRQANQQRMQVNRSRGMRF
ncbi:relaxase/mobilization nuclease domain-containing protein [Rosenbergiella nectarea]|uniref:relaxase/mobilization nuclease domain-containing protein n=1 Tax=Rosenbergiella nectarea TaxID=988801 RepID=UPI001F4EC562|nr:relaxase/mobilization nuclease domain-containing protein [Rosenbergiella nectarea]